MARTKNSKPAMSATTSSAAGRTAKTEGARSKPVETPNVLITPRTKAANTRESASKSQAQSRIQNMTKTKADARIKTDAEAGTKRKTNPTGRQSSRSLQPEPHAKSSEHRPAAAIWRKEMDRKPEIKRQVAADPPIMAPADPEILDLPDAPASLLELSAEVDLAILDLPDAPASLLEPSDETDLEVFDLAAVPASPLASSAKVARSAKQEAILRKLEQALGAFTSARQLGQVAGDIQFAWSETNGLDLRPDLAFISCERWAQCPHVPTNHVWHVVPDLVVEIIRSSDQTEKLRDSLEAYFRSGVNRVWIVYPEHLKIHDHDSLTASRVLGRDDMIDGRAILPGFRLAVNELLAE
jgi:Uma2 family endonuclease